MFEFFKKAFGQLSLDDRLDIINELLHTKEVGQLSITKAQFKQKTFKDYQEFTDNSQLKVIGAEDSPLQIEIDLENNKARFLNQWTRLKACHDWGSYKHLNLGIFSGIFFCSSSCEPCIWTYSTSSYSGVDTTFYIQGLKDSKNQEWFKIPTNLSISRLISAIETFNMFHNNPIKIQDLRTFIMSKDEIKYATPLGSALYTDKMFDIASVVAFAELNRPKDPLHILEKATSTLKNKIKRNGEDVN